MADQRIDQRPVGMAGGGVDDEPGRLVDDDEMLVLVDDVERDVLALDGQIFRRGRVERDGRPRGELARGVARDLAVDEDAAVLDQRLEPRAGKPFGATCAR